MRIEKDYAATLAAINTALTFQQQADAFINQTNPVSGTVYPVLPTTLNTRIISITTKITWAVTQPTPLTIIITIDGQVYTLNIDNPTSNTTYDVRFASGFLDAQTSSSVASGPRAFLLEGRSISIDSSITWAVTQPTPLLVRVIYAKR